MGPADRMWEDSGRFAPGPPALGTRVAPRPLSHSRNKALPSPNFRA